MPCAVSDIAASGATDASSSNGVRLPQRYAFLERFNLVAVRWNAALEVYRSANAKPTGGRDALSRLASGLLTANSAHAHYSRTQAARLTRTVAPPKRLETCQCGQITIESARVARPARAGLTSVAAAALGPGTRSANAIMHTRGAARDRSGARRPTGTVEPARFNSSTPPAPNRRRGTSPGPGRRRLSPSVKGGGWLVGCPVR